MKEQKLIRAAVKPVPISVYQTKPGKWFVFDEQANCWVEWPTPQQPPRKVLPGQVDIFGNVYGQN